MKYLHIYKIGALLLVIVLVINILAGFAGLMNWYDFIDSPARADIIDLLWLFVGYPLLLGAAALTATKIVSKPKP